MSSKMVNKDCTIQKGLDLFQKPTYGIRLCVVLDGVMVWKITEAMSIFTLFSYKRFRRSLESFIQSLNI